MMNEKTQHSESDVVEVGVIGSGGDRSAEAVESFAVDLGEALVDRHFRIVCGGLGGVMKAVCRGAHRSEQYREGMTVGIVPSSRAESANQFVDVVIPTGMGHLRNALVVQSRAVVAIGGGAGTLSEMALAWVHGRPVFAADIDASGWSAELAGRALDHRRQDDKWLSTVHRVTEPVDAAERLAAWRRERVE